MISKEKIYHLSFLSTFNALPGENDVEREMILSEKDLKNDIHLLGWLD